jgi:hypothetical protein
MAGRGQMNDLGQDDSMDSLEVWRFNALGEWETCPREPFHADVDIRNKHRCGVGPARSFVARLRSIEAHRVELCPALPSRRRIIGLVPCAVGASSLCDWLPEAPSPPLEQAYFTPMVPGHLGADIDEHEKNAKAEGSESGAPNNFFNSAVARTLAAVAAFNSKACEGNNGEGRTGRAVVRGCLWYQGGTEAMLGDGGSDASQEALQPISALPVSTMLDQCHSNEEEGVGARYRRRFVRFTNALRCRLATPRLPIVTVAVNPQPPPPPQTTTTTTTTTTKHEKKKRKAINT